MNKNEFFNAALILSLLLSLTGCRLGRKSETYTTTLAGIVLHVPSLTGGIVNRLNVKEGDWVQLGDTLAILDTRELKYQADQIDASLQELASQNKIAENNLAQANQDFAYVQEKQQRTQRLVQGDVLPQQNEDDVNNLLQKSQTAVTIASNQLTLLQASADKLHAQKKILLKKISDALIVSPAEGKVTVLYYRQGEALAPYANLLEIINTRTLEAKVYLSEGLLAQIKTGQQMEIITQSRQRFAARVSFISNKAEFTPKTILTKDTRASMVYAVTLKVENRDDILKDGMPVEVQL